jgi:OmcA/MtrC family decaheme c-type cytochrome
MIKGEYLLKHFTNMALCCALILTLAALTGCSGDTGATGPQGPAGPPGETAPSEVTLQDLASLGLVYASDVTPINPVLDLSKTVSFDAATGTLTVHFFLTDGKGNGIDITKIPYEMRLYVSELVPASEGPTDNPGPAWNQLISESGTPAMAGSQMPGKLTLVSAASGEYTYVLAKTLKATDHVIRVTLVTLFRFRDNNNQYVYVANPANASYDFLESAPGTELASSGADMVTTAACQACHGGQLKDADHGRYTDVKTCNNCHNVNYMSTHDPNADLAFLIHSIHAAKNFSVGNYSEVTFPQNGAAGAGDVFRCGTCHNGPQASLAYSNPTRMNCGSCHTNVDFATGTGHGGGPQATDANCTGCHSPSAIQGYHDPANRTPAADVPEFDIAITMTPPGNGQYYVAGEAPMVTVTLKNHATGQPVDPSVYTSAKGAAGASGGGLNLANLYVYGPRSFAVPVLTTGSTTDTVTPATPPTQGHALFPGGSDSRVKTDASGYHYQLMAIPAGMAAGTYIVQFQGQDYGAVSATDYVTTSSYKINFQVGTATAQHKVSGDACAGCHDDTRMHAEGAHAHNVPFDTDYCLACHDHSGNHGDYIGNRVHAVHSSSATGDFTNHDWSEISFGPRQEAGLPNMILQNPNNCTICHTDPNAPVPTQIYMLACGGCHGVMPNADASAYDPDEQDKVLNEISAAQHMQQNGGDATVDAAGGSHTLSCLTCHSAGKIEDITKTHNLNSFPPEPTPAP